MKRKGKKQVPNCVPTETKADAAELSGLKRNGDGKVYYQCRWWKPNEPVESTAKGKKKMVLAVKNGKVKIVHFGADGYGHNYSESARKSYLARSAGIKGTNDKHSANYWARKVLWAGKGGSVSRPKADALLERLDKACGESFIPDDAKCTKPTTAATGTPTIAQQLNRVRRETAELRGELSGKKAGRRSTKKGEGEDLKAATGTKKQAKGKARGKKSRLPDILRAGAGVALIAGYAGLTALQVREIYRRGQERKKAAAEEQARWADFKKSWAAGERDRQAGTQEEAERWRESWRRNRGRTYEQESRARRERREQERQTASRTSSGKTSSGKDWHTVLGVGKDASPSEVKAAFRKKARETHPDVNEGRDKGFNEVNEAWAIAQAFGKVRRGDSIEMEWFIKRLDALRKVAT
jgi:hypothetical protein